MPVRCLLVDDSEEFLASATRWLESEGVDVAGRATTGADALRIAETEQPDLILVDVELGDEDGVEVALNLRTAVPKARVALISAYDRDEIVDLIKPAGKIGFVPKSALCASTVAELMV